MTLNGLIDELVALRDHERLGDAPVMSCDRDTPAEVRTDMCSVDAVCGAMRDVLMDDADEPVAIVLLGTE